MTFGNDARHENPKIEEKLEKKTDESWKVKAREEKEKLSDVEPSEGEEELPPASFTGLVEELSLRAMFALGQVRHPATGEVYLDLESAKHTIDLLSIIEEKTKGNLEPLEERGLKELLQNLRLAFVHISRNPPPVVEEVGDEMEGPALRTPGQKSSSEKPGPKIIL